MIFVPRTPLLTDSWDSFCLAHPAAWFWHREEWITYLLAHSGGTDYSFALTDLDGRILAICPLILEGREFSGGHDPLPCPLIAESLDETDHANAYWKILDVIEHAAQVTGATRIRFRHSPLAAQPETMPFSFPLSYWTDISWGSQVVDLTHDPDALWRDIRKSYHALIHRVCDYEQVIVGIGPQSEGLFLEYETLHRARARTPRPAATYALMRSWSRENCVVSLIRDPESGEPVAAMLCLTYKDRVYYASGAYARDNLGHGLMLATILACKAAGAVAFEVGWQGQATDHKGENIEFYKRGFGGTTLPLKVIERRWDGNQHGTERGSPPEVSV